MGMAVFSGMLIATIPRVLLIPMLYVAGREGHRREARAPPPDAGGPAALEHGAEA